MSSESGRLAERLSSLLAEKSAVQLFSGVVSLRRQHEILFEAAVGYAHRGWRIHNRVDTRFRIASISKMFTAVAILQLVEAGSVRLDTRVPAYLGLTSARLPPALTVEHLLTMTGGIADWIDEEGIPEENWATFARTYPIYLLRQNRDYLPFFVDKEPLNAVGERYRYSNAGYILLGLVIEQAAGENYFDYVREHIFR